MAQSLVANTPENWRLQMDAALDLDDVVTAETEVGTNRAREVPAGAIDSTNGTDGNGAYTSAHTPYPAEIQLFKNGILVSSDNYTLTGDDIVYDAGQHPTVGDTHEAIYSY